LLKISLPWSKSVKQTVLVNREKSDLPWSSAGEGKRGTLAKNKIVLDFFAPHPGKFNLP